MPAGRARHTRGTAGAPGRRAGGRCPLALPRGTAPAPRDRAVPARARAVRAVAGPRVDSGLWTLDSGLDSLLTSTAEWRPDWYCGVAACHAENTESSAQRVQTVCSLAKAVDTRLSTY